MLAGKPRRKVLIQVFRDSHGRWWLDDDDAKKLAPYLEVDSSIKLDCLVCSSNDSKSSASADVQKVASIKG
jgi:hypothetical protein